MTEYLFRNPALLNEVINIAIEDNTFRSDDLEFTFAARVSTFILFLALLGLYISLIPYASSAFEYWLHSVGTRVSPPTALSQDPRFCSVFRAGDITDLSS